MFRFLKWLAPITYYSRFAGTLLFLPGCNEMAGIGEDKSLYRFIVGHQDACSNRAYGSNEI